jgi:hypothetical protein
MPKVAKKLGKIEQKFKKIFGIFKNPRLKNFKKKILRFKIFLR